MLLLQRSPNVKLSLFGREWKFRRAKASYQLSQQARMAELHARLREHQSEESPSLSPTDIAAILDGVTREELVGWCEALAEHLVRVGENDVEDRTTLARQFDDEFTPLNILLVWLTWLVHTQMSDDDRGKYTEP